MGLSPGRASWSRSPTHEPSFAPVEFKTHFWTPRQLLRDHLEHDACVTYFMALKGSRSDFTKTSTRGPGAGNRSEGHICLRKRSRERVSSCIFFFFYEDFFYFLFFLKKGELFWASWRKLSTSCQQQETSITRRELLLHSFHVCNSSSLVLGHAATRNEAWAFKEAVFFSQFPLRKDTKCSWCFAEIFPRLKPLTMISGSLLEAGYSLPV